MSENRILAELLSIFGQDAVEEAIKNKASIIRWQITSVYNRLTVIEAQRKLKTKITSLHEAVSFASGLDTTVKLCVILGVLTESERSS